jgi:hypothetical protein
MAVYQKKTLNRARPITKRLMEQANTLFYTLEAVKKLVPKVAQVESDFAHGMIDDIHQQYMAEAKRTKPSVYDQGDNPCWRCANVPTELLLRMADTPERIAELFEKKEEN